MFFFFNFFKNRLILAEALVSVIGVVTCRGTILVQNVFKVVLEPIPNPLCRHIR